jgi:hypothetical protein
MLEPRNQTLVVFTTAKDTETLGKYANDPIDEDKYNANLIASYCQ